MLALEYDPELARQAWIEYGEARGWTKEKILKLADTNGGESI